MSAAVIDAETCVADTNEVVMLVPFHCMVELETKLDPFTVSVKDEPPLRTNAGANEEIAGAGLSIMKDALADAPPLGAGLVTVTLAVPAASTSAAVMTALSWVAET
jgi:hypothetical protein